MQQKSVLFPGSFDPITNGHIDVILRLKKMFDHVVVLVTDSPKKNYMFSADERVQLIYEALSKHKTVEVITSKKLTVKVAESKHIAVIARSARSVVDWEYEYAIADANKKLSPNIDTIFVMADPNYASISSSLVREIAQYNGDISLFVPENVTQALNAKLNQKFSAKEVQ